MANTKTAGVPGRAAALPACKRREALFEPLDSDLEGDDLSDAPFQVPLQLASSVASVTAGLQLVLQMIESDDAARESDEGRLPILTLGQAWTLRRHVIGCLGLLENEALDIVDRARESRARHGRAPKAP